MINLDPAGDSPGIPRRAVGPIGVGAATLPIRPFHSCGSNTGQSEEKAASLAMSLLPIGYGLISSLMLMLLFNLLKIRNKKSARIAKTGKAKP